MGRTAAAAGYWEFSFRLYLYLSLWAVLFYKLNATNIYQHENCFRKAFKAYKVKRYGTGDWDGSMGLYKLHLGVFYIGSANIEYAVFTYALCAIMLKIANMLSIMTSIFHSNRG